MYLAVVDREGNIASWIQSISAVWGSGIAVEGAGFMLHNRGAGFVTTPGHPNRIERTRRGRNNRSLTAQDCLELLTNDLTEYHLLL